MDDPRLEALMRLRREKPTASVMEQLAALDAVDATRQPVPADAVPDAAVEAMQKSLRGSGWSVLDGCVDDLRQALAAALPHLAPHAVAAEPTPDAWIEGDTVAMLRAVVFPGSAAGFISPRWEARLKTAARRIDERIAAGPVVAQTPVWTAEREALKFLMDRQAQLRHLWTAAEKLQFKRIYDAAFKPDQSSPNASPVLSRCLSRPPCVTECAEVGRCAHAGLGQERG